MIAAALLVPWRRLPVRAQTLIPLAYFGVVAVLLPEHGHGLSPFATLAILPLLWLSLYDDAFGMWAGVATLTAMFTTVAIATGGHNEIAHAVLWSLAAAVLGPTIQLLVAEIRARAADLQTVAVLVRRMNTAPDVRMTLCDAAQLLARADLVAVAEPTPAGDAIEATAWSGSDDPAIVRIPLEGARSGAVLAFTSGESVYVSNAPRDLRVNRSLAKTLDMGSILFEPLAAGNRPLGVLVVGFRDVGHELLDRQHFAIRVLAQEGAIVLERADRVRALEEEATTDRLTGASNRRAWDAHLELAMDRSDPARAPLSLVVADLDHFKEFNDAYGHQEGDRLLAELVDGWQPLLRQGDLLARYGGEEFGILLPGATDRSAGIIAERMRARVPRGQTCSFGVAEWDGTESADALFGRADRAVYEAKHSGRDRVAHAPTVRDAGRTA